MLFLYVHVSCWCVEGGMFEYVSCANYMGETLEWVGYAIACWSAVAAQFSLWTFLFLGSRALQHHRSVCASQVTLLHMSSSFNVVLYNSYV